MAANFRILNQRPVYFDLQGRPASGGYLLFFDNGTSTPKNVYASKGGAPVPNGNRVDLLPSGQTEVDVWGDGAYRMFIYKADDTLIAGPIDDVEIPGGTDQAIPALEDGEFLTNNGSLLLWAPVRQLPDPTGQDGKVPQANGGTYTLVPFPTIPTPPDPEIVVTETDTANGGFQAGVSTDGTKFFQQWGIGTAPATNASTTNVPITFTTPFKAGTQPNVQLTPRNIQPGGPVVAYTNGDATSTGFTAVFDVAEGTNQNNKIVNTVHFYWLASGFREVP